MRITSQLRRLAVLVAALAVVHQVKSTHDRKTAEQERQRTEALKQAIGKEDAAKILTLVDGGVDVNTPGPLGRTALHYAAESNPFLVRQLLARRASVHSRDMFGHTPLMFAAHGGNLSAAEVLISAGAAVGERTNEGVTALMLAAFLRRPDRAMIELLLSFGARIGERDDQGNTILHFAAYRGTGDDIAYLIRSGAPPDTANERGWTPLMKAASLNNVAAVPVLLQHGAELDRRNSEGLTVEMLLMRMLRRRPSLDLSTVLRIIRARRADASRYSPGAQSGQADGYSRSDEVIRRRRRATPHN